MLFLKSEMAMWVRTCATRLGHLSFIPKTYWEKTKTGLHKLSSDFQTHTWHPCLKHTPSTK